MARSIKFLNLFLIICLIISFSCNLDKSVNEDNLSYIKEISDWKNKRIASLKNKNGWLSLAGLFLLNEGENSFGSASSNDIIFPSGKAPDFIGWFVLKDEQISVQIKPDVKVLYKDEPVDQMLLKSNAEGNPTILSLGSLNWFIIKSGETFAVRLKDSENPILNEFKRIESYPVDPAWRIKANFEPYNPPKKISLITIIGTTEEETSPGALIFKVKDKIFQLSS